MSKKLARIDNFDPNDPDPVDWTVFDKPLPPDTPIDPREIEMRKMIARRMEEVRIATTKKPGQAG